MGVITDTGITAMGETALAEAEKPAGGKTILDSLVSRLRERGRFYESINIMPTGIRIGVCGTMESDDGELTALVSVILGLRSVNVRVDLQYSGANTRAKI